MANQFDTLGLLPLKKRIPALDAVPKLEIPHYTTRKCLIGTRSRLSFDLTCKQLAQSALVNQQAADQTNARDLHAVVVSARWLTTR